MPEDLVLLRLLRRHWTQLIRTPKDRDARRYCGAVPRYRGVVLGWSSNRSLLTRRVTSLTLASAGLAACSGSGDVSLLGLIEIEPGVLEFSTSCADDDVEVQVEESDDAVRISDARGTSIDGDCLGSVFVELETPLDGRAVVVDGERWVQVASCPDGYLGPPDLTEERDC